MGNVGRELAPLADGLPVVRRVQADAAKRPLELRRRTAIAVVLAGHRPDRAAEALLHHGVGCERKAVARQLSLPGEAVVGAPELEPLVAPDLARHVGPDAHVAPG